MDSVSRFWAKVPSREQGACWPWGAYCDSRGYGRFFTDGKSERAHRFSLSLVTPPPFVGASALHSCDNPICVNPAHLRWGAQADNMKDRAQRGRTNQSQLRAEDVAAIRESNRTQRALATEYGISQSAVSLIKRGINWRHG